MKLNFTRLYCCCSCLGNERRDEAYRIINRGAKKKSKRGGIRTRVVEITSEIRESVVKLMEKNCASLLWRHKRWTHKQGITQGERKRLCNTVSISVRFWFHISDESGLTFGRVHYATHVGRNRRMHPSIEVVLKITWPRHAQARFPFHWEWLWGADVAF